jgi:hypothetical protein
MVDLLFFHISAHPEAHSPKHRWLFLVLDEPRMSDLLMSPAQRYDILRKVAGKKREAFHMVIHLGLPVTTWECAHRLMFE